MMRISHTARRTFLCIVALCAANVLVDVVRLENVDTALPAFAEQVHPRVLAVGVGTVARVAGLADLETFAAADDCIDISSDNTLERCSAGVLPFPYKTVVQYLLPRYSFDVPVAEYGQKDIIETFGNFHDRICLTQQI